MEIIQRAVRERQLLLRHVSPELRGDLCMLQSVHLSRVRGNIQRGDKPHISFFHVRYTSHQLAQSAQLIGQSLGILYDADDIRVLRAYRADGTELGELKAGGLWSVSPHSLELRKRIWISARIHRRRRRHRLRPTRFPTSPRDPSRGNAFASRRATPKSHRDQAKEIGAWRDERSRSLNIR